MGICCPTIQETTVECTFMFFVQVEVTLNCVLDSSQLEGHLTKGERFFSLFLLSVVDHMLQYPDECIDALFNSISDYSDYKVEIILHLLRRCQHPSKVCHGYVVRNILK